MIFESFLETQGLDMQIERCGEIVATAPGLPNREKATNRRYIGFRPGTDIKIDDVVINPAKERFYIIETQASYFQKQQEQIKAFYMTEVEKKTERNGTTPEHYLQYRHSVWFCNWNSQHSNHQLSDEFS